MISFFFCRVQAAMRRPCARTAGFSGSTGGAAAIEFALIAPLMIAIYFLTMEFSQAIEINRKLGRATVQVGDLVTQQAEMTPAALDAIMKISESTLQPYRRSTPVMKLAAIRVTDEPSPKAVVVWSRRYSGGSGARDLLPGSEIAIPADLKTPGAFLVRSELELRYQPVLAWSDAAKKALGMVSLHEIEMGERYFQHPRMTSAIDCGAC